MRELRLIWLQLAVTGAKMRQEGSTHARDVSLSSAAWLISPDVEEIGRTIDLGMSVAELPRSRAAGLDGLWGTAPETAGFDLPADKRRVF